MYEMNTSPYIENEEGTGRVMRRGRKETKERRTQENKDESFPVSYCCSVLFIHFTKQESGERNSEWNGGEMNYTSDTSAGTATYMYATKAYVNMCIYIHTHTEKYAYMGLNTVSVYLHVNMYMCVCVHVCGRQS